MNAIPYVLWGWLATSIPVRFLHLLIYGSRQPQISQALVLQGNLFKRGMPGKELAQSGKIGNKLRRHKRPVPLVKQRQRIPQ